MSSTSLINVPAGLPTPASREVSLDTLLRLKCRTMEAGLSDLRLALKTMRTTCAALDMHAEMLELEIENLKNMHAEPASMDQYEGGFRSTMNNLELSSDVNNRVVSHSNLLTPPATPIKSTGTYRRDSVSIFEKITRKRSSLDAALDDWDFRESCLDPRPRISRKRVRFADVQDTPISNTGNQLHELPSSSSSDYPPPPTPLFSFQLPEVIAPYPSEPDVRQPEIITEMAPSHSSTKVRLSRRTKDCRVRIRSGDRISAQNVLHRKRTKTRWDPSTGKRVPVATAVVDGSRNRELTFSAPTEGDDNYELRLSESFSQTSLVK